MHCLTELFRFIYTKVCLALNARTYFAVHRVIIFKKENYNN